MDVRALLLYLAAGASFAGIANSQAPRPGIGATSPNMQNRNLDTMLQIELLEEQRRLEAQQQHDVQVAQFMQAIKPRKNRYPDFDQVVTHGKAPMTLDMIALMAKSPYAADIAYYLGTHPEQSGAITQMRPEDTRSAMRQIEASVAIGNAPKILEAANERLR
jgi:hypothetical protein